MNAGMIERAVARAGGVLGSLAGGAVSGYVKAAGGGLQDPAAAALFNSWEASSGIAHIEDLRSNLSAYEVSWVVYSCVRAIAGQGASIPVVLYQKRGDERREWKQLTSHPILDRLANPNPDAMETDFDLLEALFSDWELSGSWYLYVIRDDRGLPIRIYRMRPDLTHVVPGKTRRVDGYLFKVGTQSIPFEPEDVVQSKTFHPTSDTEGLSSIAAARLPITLDTEGMRYNVRFFRNNATPRGYLKTPGKIDAAVKDKLREDFVKAHQGTENAHKVGILQGGLEYVATGIAQKDMEFVLQSQMSEERIMACFHVQPGIVGIQRYSNYANLAEQRKSFWHETMIPKLGKMQRALTRGLCWPYDKSLVLEFDLTQVYALIQNALEMAQVDAALLGSKMYTINERRAERGLPPVWWGDEPWIQIQDYQAERGSSGPLSLAAPKLLGVPKTLAAPKRMYTESRALTARQLAFEVVVAPSRAQFAGKVETILGKQHAEVLKNMRGEKRSLGAIKAAIERRTKAEAEGHEITADMLKAASLVEIISWLYDREYWLSGSIKAVHPTLLNAAQRAGLFGIGEVHVDVDFNLASPHLQETIKQHEFVFAQTWNDSTLGELSSQLGEGILAGENMSELIARVDAVFDHEKTNAPLVAQTEVGSISNAACREGWKQSGVVPGREWRNASRNPRPHHLVADGKFVDSGLPAIVGIDEPYVVMGEQLMYPGDKAGSPSNVCNEHCIELPVLGEE